MKSTRRQFIAATGASLAAASIQPVSTWAKASNPGGSHRPVPVPGLHGYPSVQTVAAGEKIDFHISSTVPYQLSICRLGRAIDDPAGDPVVHRFRERPPLAQPIFPGSYVAVSKALPKSMAPVSCEIWVKPWQIGRRQSVFAARDGARARGVELFLSEKGQARLYIGPGSDPKDQIELIGPVLAARQWAHLAAVHDGKTASLWVDGKLALRVPVTSPLQWVSPLRFGAAVRDGLVDDFLDGDIALPVIYNRALTAEEIGARFKDRGLTPPTSGLVACWRLDEERGAAVRDLANGYHGQIVNRGTWMIGGPSFNCDLPRYDDYQPARDPQRGHALRLAADDLYDCGWKPSQTWKVPSETRSGCYVARAEYEWEGRKLIYDISFVIKPGRRAKKAPILVLTSSNTWRAYNGTPFFVNEPGPHQFWGTEGRKSVDPRAPSYNFYRDHAAGQPTYQVGLRMPWPAAGPHVLYSKKEVGYSHLLRGERFTHAWLEENGYAFDVIDDVDLHRHPEQLRDYRVLILNGHSEYWSIAMYEGVERFLGAGGNVAVLSGNSVFWRVSFDEAAEVMECRKFDSSIGGRASACIGELWHADDGLRGSLMRECGYPAWKLIGLECIGWWGTGPEDFGWYQADDTSHFLYHTPHPTGLQPGETFGHGVGKVVPRAVGHEADIRLSTLKRYTAATPAGASLPEEPPGISTLASSRRDQYRGLDFFTHWQNMSPAVLAEMIYWERAGGGKVFNAGAIAAGWALGADPKWSALFKNVLHHFTRS